MDPPSTFLRPQKANLGASVSTNRHSQVSDRSHPLEKQDENAAPASRLTLKKQLIELREDKTNYDMLFARFNGLQHKQRLLEEDRLKMKSQFEARQRESLAELEALQTDLSAVRARNEAKEREISAIRENNERMIARLASYEEQLKENAALKEKEDAKVAREKAYFDELVREKTVLEEEQRAIQRKVEQTEEEVAEVEQQMKTLAKTEKELSDEMSNLMMEIKRQEGQRVALEAAAERQNEFLKCKMEEKEALETKLMQAERLLDEQVKNVQLQNERVRQLQKDFAASDKRLAETEMQVAELEHRRAEVAREREAREVEVIDQTRRLKQLDIELAGRDQELKEQTASFDTMATFTERMLRQLEAFEAENREVSQMVGNIDELTAAVEKFDGVISDCKEFLASL